MLLSVVAGGTMTDSALWNHDVDPDSALAAAPDDEEVGFDEDDEDEDFDEDEEADEADDDEAEELTEPTDD